MASGDNYQVTSRKNILVLFDVDGTLTPARGSIKSEMHSYLMDLRKRVFVGLVGGSNLEKITEQMIPPGLKIPNECREDILNYFVASYDYVFAENGLVAYRAGELLTKQSLLNQLGEEKVQKFINFCLEYMSKLKLPAKRGNFIEFRKGLINVCPVGRSCSQKEREQFNAYDNEHGVRKKFIEELEYQFGPHSEEPLGLVFTIGGQISFDAFPKGWDKTYCLNLVGSTWDEIHFFGDKTSPGGNDYEIFVDSRTKGHTVWSPDDTLDQLKRLNL